MKSLTNIYGVDINQGTKINFNMSLQLNSINQLIEFLFLEIVKDVNIDNVSMTKSSVAGTFSPSLGTEIYDSSCQTTPTHETIHEIGYNTNKDISLMANNSFDEGFAYAGGDYFCNQRLANTRRTFSLEVRKLLKDIDWRKSHNWLKDSRIKEFVQLTNVNYNPENWASLMKSIDNFQHYALFYDLFQKYDEEAISIGLKGIQRIQGSNHKDALSYIRSHLNGQVEYDLTTIPTINNDFYNIKNFAIKITDDQNNVLKVITNSKRLIRSVAETINNHGFLHEGRTYSNIKVVVSNYINRFLSN